MLLLVLAGCAGPSMVRIAPDHAEAAQAARELDLAGQRRWSFTGRVAVANGDNGGSGRIEWTQDGDDFDIRLSAPVTRQGWRLVRADGRVRLEGLEGGPREGFDAEALLLDATGWRLPVASMSSWVRGLRGPGEAAIAGDPAGLPATLVQGGWRVEYKEWDTGAPPMPRKIHASQGQASVRLAIEQWTSP
jgi:outer membrane lipoprotein LolB